jgi:hypothetical protein
MNDKILNIDAKFKKLEKLLRDKVLISKETLGGEIPFFLFPYLPEDNTFVDKEVGNLKKKLSNIGIEILVIDLFELSVDVLIQKNLLIPILSKEASIDKAIFTKQIRTPLDVNSVIAPEIERIVNNNEFDALFIKGVGSIFPIIRSHNLLNNLQSKINDKPLILFFPGFYDNQKLELFDKMKEDNYYRAFNLDNLQI